MPQDLRISVITPSFNQGKFIQATLDSILKQDYPHVEHIVMDGGSTDETVDILKNVQDSRLKWTSERDNGQSDAINKGLHVASGDILAYLNSDDIYLDGTLAFVADYFQTHPEVDFIYGDCLTIDTEGKILPVVLKTQSFNLRDALTMRMRWAQPAFFWRREVTAHIGLFDETFHYLMDQDYWLRMVLADYKPDYIPRNMAAFRFHGGSKTTNQIVKFNHDWAIIIQKIYQRTDLSPGILELKRTAFLYVNFYLGHVYLLEKQGEAARQHLLHVLLKGRLRLRVLAFMMIIDSFFPKPWFSQAVINFYRRSKGLVVIDDFFKA